MFPFPSFKRGCTASFVAYSASVCVPGILQRLLCSPGYPAQSLLMGLLSDIHYNCFLRDLPLDSSVLPGLENSFRRFFTDHKEGLFLLTSYSIYFIFMCMGRDSPCCHGDESCQVSRRSGRSLAAGRTDGRETLWVPLHCTISKQTQALNLCLWLRCWFSL